jgi:RNA-binding protein
MQLTTMQKKQLKVKAHTIKPVVFTGINGFTDNVKNEINRALDDHELIKIRIQETDRVLRRQLFQEICATVSAEAIQFIGGIGVLYRKNPNKNQPGPHTKRALPASKRQSAKNKAAKNKKLMKRNFQ